MASKAKKTTMAKLNREAKLRERRLEKQARRDARKTATPDQPPAAGDAAAGDASAGANG